MTNLTGKVAIVTGAGQGIGRSHALYLSQMGAKVVVNDLGGSRFGAGADSSLADAVVEEIRARGGEAVANHASVATLDGAESIIWTAMSKFGRLDILVNNAGILRDRTLVNMSVEDFDRVVEVHLKGTFLTMRAAARQLKMQDSGGRIINTSSVSGLIGNFGQGNYAAAKAGIYGLTRAAAFELERIKVTVNAIAPVALTRMTSDLPRFQAASEDDLGPKFISPVVGFLASDLAAHITGKVFGVQGRRIFEYRMETNEGVTLDSGEWSPELINERLGDLIKSA